jgi:hypothetical protein
MKAPINPQNGNLHCEFIPDLDLCELHRWLAALMNAHIHHDLRGMPEVERQTAMADVLEQIEELMAFERMPWQAALEAYIQ